MTNGRDATHPEAMGPRFGRAGAGQDFDRLLKPSEVARMLGVSRTWLYQAAKDGRVPALRLGGPDGPLRFAPDALEEWIGRARAAWRVGDSSDDTLRRAGRRRAA